MKNLGVVTREVGLDAIKALVQSAGPILGRQPDTVSVNGMLYAVWRDGPEQFACAPFNALRKGLYHKTAEEIAKFFREVVREHHSVHPIKIQITARTKPKHILRIVRSTPVCLGDAAQLLDIGGKPYRLWRSRIDQRFYCEGIPERGRRGCLFIAETAAEMSKRIGVIADIPKNPKR